MKVKRRWFVVSTLGVGLLIAGCGGSGGGDAADDVTTTVTVEPTTVEPTTAEPTTVEPTTVEPTTPVPASTTVPPPTSASTRQASPVPSPTRAKARVPRQLVGTWVTFGDANAKQLYDFTADGLYTFAGILQQKRSSGMFTFTLSAQGTVVVSRTSLVLRPSGGTRSLRDPDSPSSNYDRPISTEPETYEWDITDDTLSLTDNTGLTLQYARE